MTPTPDADPYREAVEKDAYPREGNDRYHHVAANGILVCPVCGVSLMDADGMPEPSLDLVDEDGHDADAPDPKAETRHYHRGCYKQLVAERRSNENQSLDDFGMGPHA